MSAVTSYTEGILNGKINTLKDYIKTCSRAFEPYYLREKPISDILDTSGYDEDIANYEECLKKTISEYKKWKTDDVHTSYLDYIEKVKKGLKSWEEGLVRVISDNTKYNNMLEKLKGWETKSKYTENIKRFAVNQISSCLTDIKFYEDEVKLYREKLSTTEEQYSKIIIENTRKGYEEDIKFYRNKIESIKGMKDEYMDWYNSVMSELDEINN